jgi:hypothetical protein
MTDMRGPQGVTQSAPQLRYALLVEWGTRIGLVVLAASFIAYVAGWAPAHVPPHELPRYWSQPVAQFLVQTGSPQGWGWLALLHRSDMLGLAGIVILAGSSAIAVLALLPLYLRQGDRPFAVLCLLQAGVLITAASGVLVE